LAFGVSRFVRGALLSPRKTYDAHVKRQERHLSVIGFHHWRKAAPLQDLVDYEDEDD